MSDDRPNGQRESKPLWQALQDEWDPERKGFKSALQRADDSKAAHRAAQRTGEDAA